MEQQADDNVPTTADIHAQYKTKAPKFEEKISNIRNIRTCGKRNQLAGAKD